jgi:hypothetical protein
MATDVIESKTSRNPMIRGGSNIKTMELRRIGNNQIDFSITSVAIGFLSFFFILGLVTMALTLFHGSIPNSNSAIAIFVLGSLFLLFSTIAFIFGNKFTFKNNNGKLSFSKSNFVSSSVSTKKIYAIQFLEKIISGDSDSSPYTCYEVNIVFEDASRKNILNYGGKIKHFESILRDATILVEFLNVPFWNNMNK